MTGPDPPPITRYPHSPSVQTLSPSFVHPRFFPKPESYNFLCHSAWTLTDFLTVIDIFLSLGILSLPVFITFFFFFWPLCMACRILVPQPGIESAPRQEEPRVLTSGPPGKAHLASSRFLTPGLHLPTRTPLVTSCWLAFALVLLRTTHSTQGGLLHPCRQSRPLRPLLRTVPGMLRGYEGCRNEGPQTDQVA